MRGFVLLGDAAVEKYRLVAVIVGLLVFACWPGRCRAPRWGLLIAPACGTARWSSRSATASGACCRRVRGRQRAGRAGRRDVGLYQQIVIPQMGAQVNILIFIVIIIGGLGSTTGALIGALLVGLMANYTGFWCPRWRCFPTSR